MKARRAWSNHQEHVTKFKEPGTEMKAKAKSGLKGMIKKGAMKVAGQKTDKVVKRMSGQT